MELFARHCAAYVTCTDLLSQATATCPQEAIEGIATPSSSLISSFVQLVESSSAAAGFYWTGAWLTGTALLVAYHARWIGWACLTSLLLFIRSLYIPYQVAALAAVIVALSTLSVVTKLYVFIEGSRRWLRGRSFWWRVKLRRALKRAESYDDWQAAATALDALDGKDNWRTDRAGFNADAIEEATLQFRVARAAGDVEELVRLLRAMMQRNHMHIDDESLHSECRVGTKQLVEIYIAEVVSCIRWLAEQDHTAAHPAFTNEAKISCFERCSVCLGHTALCLSGGGSLAMYHLGVVKALIEADALPTIISGTSGGAIVAGVLAIHTNEEMLSEIIQDDIAVRHAPHRWFPPMRQQLFNFISAGVLVTHDEFEACTRAYYGTMTFQVHLPSSRTPLYAALRRSAPLCAALCRSAQPHPGRSTVLYAVAARRAAHVHGVCVRSRKRLSAQAASSTSTSRRRRVEGAAATLARSYSITSPHLTC